MTKRLEKATSEVNISILKKNYLIWNQYKLVINVKISNKFCKFVIMKTGEIKMSLQTLFELKDKHDADKDFMNKLRSQSGYDQAVIDELKIKKENLENQIRDTAKNMLNPYHYVREHPNLKHMLPDDVTDVYFNDAFDSFLMSFKRVVAGISQNIDVDDFYVVIDAEFGVSYGVTNGDMFFRSKVGDKYINPRLRIEFSGESILDFVKKGYLRKD